MVFTNSYQDGCAYNLNAIETQTEGCLVWVPQETVVMLSRDGCYNEEAIKKHNLPYINTKHEGSCIVTFAGNIQVGHFRKTNDYSFGDRVAYAVIDYLKQKGLSASLENNDVLIDNKWKVFSYSSRVYGEILSTWLNCTINCDLDLIREICTKPMVKVPRALSDYGITTEEMLSLLRTYLE